MWIYDDNYLHSGNFGVGLYRSYPAMGVSIQNGTFQTALLYPSAIDTYKFCGDANDFITLICTQTCCGDGLFLPTLQIYDPNGSLFKEAQGYSVRFDTTLTSSGVYTIWVYDDNYRHTGNFGLGLSGDILDTLCTVVPVSYTHLTLPTNREV